MSNYQPRKTRTINWGALFQSGRRDNAGCAGCYYATADLFCCYILRQGHRRPCAPRPGGGCACYLAAQKGPVVTPSTIEALYSSRYLFSQRQRWQMQHPSEVPDDLDEAAALALYRHKASDLQIALALRCSKAAVYAWRKANGLKSNFKPPKGGDDP